MDLTIPISGAAIGACLLGLAVWAIKKKIDQYDEHIESCNEKDIHQAALYATLETKVDEVTEDIRRMDAKLDTLLRR